MYEKYTGTKNTHMRENIFRLADAVDSSKLRVRVPGIPGYNDEDKIRESVKWIKNVMRPEGKAGSIRLCCSCRSQQKRPVSR